MKHILYILLFTLATLAYAGCTLPELPKLPELPPGLCAVTGAAERANHIWGNEKGAYHLSDLSPVFVNQTSYDLADVVRNWNRLDTPLSLRTSGEGFTIPVVLGGDANSTFLGRANVNIGLLGHITGGTVTMNDVLLAGYPPNTAKRVLCQEIGHELGLDHQRGADDSCMDDCQGRADWLGCITSEAGTTPNAHDAEQLREIYAEGHDGLPRLGCTGSLLLHSFDVPSPD